MARRLRRPGQGISDLFLFFKPPEGWLLPVTFALGILAGFGVFIFHVSRASSYLSDDPATCVNCHVMAPQYKTWQHSSHAQVATCNDCHVPHDNIFRHYWFKGNDGLRHATIFTMRAEPQVIKIHAAGQRVVQENCVRCHVTQVDDISAKQVAGDAGGIAGMRCWDCHRTVPHGEVNSLASVPLAHVPVPGPATPEWLRRMMRADNPTIVHPDTTNNETSR